MCHICEKCGESRHTTDVILDNDADHTDGSLRTGGVCQGYFVSESPECVCGSLHTRLCLLGLLSLWAHRECWCIIMHSTVSAGTTVVVRTSIMLMYHYALCCICQDYFLLCKSIQKLLTDHQALYCACQAYFVCNRPPDQHLLIITLCIGTIFFVRASGDHRWIITHQPWLLFFVRASRMLMNCYALCCV